jgi:hypothetical protein
MDGKRKRKFCMSLRIFGINTLHLLESFRVWVKYDLPSEVFGRILSMVSCLESDWWCRGLLGLRTQGSIIGSSSCHLIQFITALFSTATHLARTLEFATNSPWWWWATRRKTKTLKGSADHQNFQGHTATNSLNPGGKAQSPQAAMSNRIEAPRGRICRPSHAGMRLLNVISEWCLNEAPPLFCGSFTELNQRCCRNLFALDPDGVTCEG